MFNLTHIRKFTISVTLFICLFCYAKCDQDYNSEYDKCNSKYGLNYLNDRKSLISSCLVGRRLFYIIEALERCDMNNNLINQCNIGCDEAYSNNDTLSVLEHKACKDGCIFQQTISKITKKETSMNQYDNEADQMAIYRPIMLISSFYSSAYNVIVTKTSIYWMNIYESKVLSADGYKEEIKRQREYKEVVMASESTYNWKVVYNSSFRNNSLAILMITSIVLLLWLFITSLIKDKKDITDTEKVSIINDTDDEIIDIKQEKLASVHSLSSVKLLLA